MKTFLTYIWCAISALLINSCQPKEFGPGGLQNGIQITDKLVASYQLLDMNNQPRYTFREGENFQFQLSFRNVNDKDTVKTSSGLGELRTDFVFDNRSVFSVVKVSIDGTAGQLMGRPIDSGFSFSFSPPGIAVVPGGTVTYRVVWQTRVSVIYPMPFFDPAAAPGNKWEEYVVKNFVRTGSEYKVETLPKGSYYSAFIVESLGKQIPFRVDFTVQ